MSMCAVLTYVMASKRRGEFGGAVKEEGEEKSDELMLLHCSSYRHTLHFVVFFLFFSHVLLHMHICIHAGLFCVHQAD